MVLLSLNWNLEVINYFVAAVLILISAFIIFREYKKVKHRFHLFLLVIWVLFSLYVTLAGISLLYLSIELFKWVEIFMIPIGFLIIYVLDSINRGTLGPIKMLIFGISSTGLIYSLLCPNAAISITLASGSPSFQTNGDYHIWLSIFSAQIAILYFTFCLMIFIQSPKILKKKAFITLLGGSFFGIFSFIFYITRLTKEIPGITMLSIGIGALISSLSFALEPELLKVLIFSAVKAKAKLIGSIIPICAHCKNIKDEEGNWHQIEKYISDHSKLLFSHGLCPVCEKEHYSDYLED